MRPGLIGRVEHLAVGREGWKWSLNCFLLCVVASWIVIVAEGWWLVVGLVAYVIVFGLCLVGLRRGYTGLLIWTACLWSLLSVAGVSIQLILVSAERAERVAGSFLVG